MIRSGLEYLANVSPATLFDQNQGMLNLSRIIEEMITHGLANLDDTTGPNCDDADRVFLLFNVAMDHGMISIITDYLQFDPIRVKEWLIRQSTELKTSLSDFLLQKFSNNPHHQQLHAVTNVGKASSYLLIAKALAAIPASVIATTTSKHTQHFNSLYGVSKSSVLVSNSDILDNYELIVHVTKIIHWLSGFHIFDLSPSSDNPNNTYNSNSKNQGRFTSFDEWKGAVDQQRLHSSLDDSLLLIDIVMKTAKSYDIYHSNTMAPDATIYPPQSLGWLIHSLFLADSSMRNLQQSMEDSATTIEKRRKSFEIKLSIIVYALIDAYDVDQELLLSSLKAYFGIHPCVSLGWSVVYYLDNARKKEESSTECDTSLQKALDTIIRVDGNILPFQILDEFTGKGRPDIALSLLRQRSTSGTGDVDEACTALRVRLANGLVAEGFIEMKRHLRTASEDNNNPQRAQQHAQKLINVLLSWGQDIHFLSRIIQLPLSLGAEESSLISWFEQSMHSMPYAPLLLTLYYLMRGRMTEACIAYAPLTHYIDSPHDISSSFSSSSFSAREAVLKMSQDERNHFIAAIKDVQGLLDAARCMMPQVQRSLQVGEAPKSSLYVATTATTPSPFTGTALIDGETRYDDGTVMMHDVDNDDVDKKRIAISPSEIEDIDTVGLISVAPSMHRAPLVGSVLSMSIGHEGRSSSQYSKDQYQLRQQRGDVGSAVGEDGGGGVLFGSGAGNGGGGRESFLAAPLPSEGMGVSGKHAFDRVFGLNYNLGSGSALKSKRKV